jgi:hypothetical protein
MTMKKIDWEGWLCLLTVVALLALAMYVLMNTHGKIL